MENNLNTLILHHFESKWNDALQKFDLDMEKMSNQIIDYLSTKGEHINNIVITKTKGVDVEPEHNKIMKYALDNEIQISIQEYGYSYYKENFTDDELKNEEFIIPTRDNKDKDNILPIKEWQKELSLHNTVSIAGAFEGECIRDMEDIVLHTRGEYDKVKELVVGSHVKYQYSNNPDKILEKIQKTIHDAEKRYIRSESKGNIEKEIENIESDLNKTLFSRKSEIAIKYYSDISEKLYSNIDEINDIISNIIIQGEKSNQYNSRMNDEQKNKLFDSFDEPNINEKKNKYNM